MVNNLYDVATGVGCAGAICSLGRVARIPGSRVRLSSSALTATNSELPAIEIAAISGLSSSPNQG